LPRAPKDLIVAPSVEKAQLQNFLREVAKEQVEGVFCNPLDVDAKALNGLRVYYNSAKADVLVVEDLGALKKARDDGKAAALSIKVESSKDIAKAVEASKLGAEAVLVQTSDWKIIPLENLIAEIHGRKTKVYSYAEPSEVTMLFTVLELGVDGVVMKASKTQEVKDARNAMKELGTITLSVAKVADVKEVGLGDRACVDTASMLNFGEGMLIGNTAKFLFLIHNESGGSKFTSPRPFRVNAGSVHCYILLPNGRTKYLSELDSGTEVMVTDKDGRSRTVIVGRVKIERRPLLLVKAESENVSAGVLVQNAETIAFVGKDGKPIPATSIKAGDEIIVKIEKTSGRHFGMAVDEFVIEK